MLIFLERSSIFRLLRQDKILYPIKNNNKNINFLIFGSCTYYISISNIETNINKH